MIIFNVSPYCLFPDDENRKFSVYYMELAPGSHWQSEPHLRGTTEFVTLFAGAIEITADQKAIVNRNPATYMSKVERYQRLKIPDYFKYSIREGY